MDSSSLQLYKLNKYSGIVRNIIASLGENRQLTIPKMFFRGEKSTLRGENACVFLELCYNRKITKSREIANDKNCCLR